MIIGDAENTANSQNVTSLAGKVLRVNPDGSSPSDNPFVSNANVNAKKVYSLGHRNSYGFTFHGQTGHLWETENGPSDNDEIDRVVSGGNYGWPTVRGIAGNPNFRDPILAFVSVIAPTNIIAILENSTVYPATYRNNLLFAAWNDGRIRRVILSGADLTSSARPAQPTTAGRAACSVSYWELTGMCMCPASARSSASFPSKPHQFQPHRPFRSTGIRNVSPPGIFTRADRLL